MFVILYLYICIYVCVCVCVCIDWFEKVHPYWEKIMYMYKQIQKKDRSTHIFSFFFSFFVLSLFNIKFVDRKKKDEKREDKAKIYRSSYFNWHPACSMHEHFISTSSHRTQMQLINWNENGKKKKNRKCSIPHLYEKIIFKHLSQFNDFPI